MELTKGTMYKADSHITEVKKIEKHHKGNLVKQTMLCNYIIDDFTMTIMCESSKKWRLHEARTFSAEKNFGDNTVRENILSLPNALAK